MIRDRIKDFRRVPVADLLENGRNFRRHPQAQKDALAGVLAEVGIAGALVAYCSERNGGKLTLIDGHARVQAGATEWPVLILDVDDAEADYLLATFDATTALAELDGVALLELLKGVQSGEPGVQQLLAQLAEQAKALAAEMNPGQTDPDAVPEPGDEAITKPGDLWILGNHRLLCGDAGKAEDVDRLLAGAPVHLVNTDPPYNVKVEPRSNNAIAAGLTSFSRREDLQCERSTTERGAQDRERLAKRAEAADAHRGLMHHQSFDVARQGVKRATTKKMRPKDRPLVNDFMSPKDFDAMLHAWFGNIARVLMPGRCFYIWGGYANLGNYPPVLKACELYFSQGIVWDKEWPVLTRKDFMGAFEICFYGWREGAGHKFFGPNNAADLWHIKKIPPPQMQHLTEKPVELARRAIEYGSRPGENVLDLFGGAGGTLIGCEMTGRRAYLMELDTLYADVIVQRFEQFTGKKAERQPQETAPSEVSK
jgi:DNA modification methylase